MKLLFHRPHHQKNKDSIERMCKSRHIDLEFTHSYDRLLQFNYDILVLNEIFIDPAIFPSYIKIIYGPQIEMIPPSGPLMGPLNEELIGRCVCNPLSEWVKNYFLEYGSMIMPIRPFPFAVDIDKFSPSDCDKTLECIIYFKHRHPSQKSELLTIANELSLNYEFFEYGSYKEYDYLAALHKARFMIVLDAHESQGFAVQEAMACGIPLVVWNASTLYDEHHGTRQIFAGYEPKKLLATSAPYWDSRCGILAKNAEDVCSAVKAMRENYTMYSPREYILENLTAEHCMDRILRYFF